MDIPPTLRLSLIPSSFDPLWFDMRNQLEDPAYLSRLEAEDRKVQGRWRAGNSTTLKGIFNRRRTAAATAGDDSSSSSSSASDAYGAAANDTVNDSTMPAIEISAASMADQTMGTTAAEGTDHGDTVDDVEIPNDTWMEDGVGLEGFVADVVTSHMDIGGGPGSSESNSDNSGMPT